MSVSGWKWYSGTKRVPLLPILSRESPVSVKENPDRIWKLTNFILALRNFIAGHGNIRFIKYKIGCVYSDLRFDHLIFSHI